jgi:hypothetical protein
MNAVTTSKMRNTAFRKKCVTMRLVEAEQCFTSTGGSECYALLRISFDVKVYGRTDAALNGGRGENRRLSPIGNKRHRSAFIGKRNGGWHRLNSANSGTWFMKGT